MTKTILTGLIGCIACAGTAWAQMPPAPPSNTVPMTATTPAAVEAMSTTPPGYIWFGNDRINEAKQMIAAGRAIEALEVLDTVIQRDMRLGEAHILRGLAYMQLKDLDKAAQAFNTILAIDRGYMGAYVYLGEIALLKKDVKQADIYLQAIRQLCVSDECAEYRYLKNAIRTAGGEPTPAAPLPTSGTSSSGYRYN